MIVEQGLVTFEFVECDFALVGSLPVAFVAVLGEDWLDLLPESGGGLALFSGGNERECAKGKKAQQPPSAEEIPRGVPRHLALPISVTTNHTRSSTKILR